MVLSVPRAPRALWLGRPAVWHCRWGVTSRRHLQHSPRARSPCGIGIQTEDGTATKQHILLLEEGKGSIGVMAQ
ncbi:hypothetical protein NDU88_000923 [Pleurodeles waltl]|uniref:Uncharacterized protein n=1 Tax=Pleurodeles waltl TaxID=8319 RepID=A0AAV7U5F6_PLEWA|nr:hypothetical protein NDU88_000923 [Pleurodeles waltl]